MEKVAQSYLKRVFIPNSPVTIAFLQLKYLKMEGWLGKIRAFLFLAMKVAEYFEIKEINTEIINENYNYDQFIADTVEYDFGEFISDIEQDLMD